MTYILLIIPLYILCHHYIFICLKLHKLLIWYNITKYIIAYLLNIYYYVHIIICHIVILYYNIITNMILILTKIIRYGYNFG